jgi:lipopolysaccharide/colanic/teichoic acid biosynthesis glycosyltransferase
MARPFRLFKFRSMVSGAAQMGAGALVEKGDSRVTRMGRLLRATSLDELPQLLNILRGEMSLVGPRPTLEYQVLAYDEFQKRRLLAKPGVTGLAQIRGRKSLDWPERIRADVEYVESISALRDLEICLLTPWTLLRGEGQAKADYWKDSAKP